MHWSICLPAYNNFTEVYFTVQSLRMHHDMRDKEIIVVDNYGKDNRLFDFCKAKGRGVVRYEKATEKTGVSYAKNRAIEIASGEFVLCMDSHILLKQGCFDIDPTGDDFIQGPCVSNGFEKIGREWLPVWRSGMWGTWNYVPFFELPKEPYPIWAIGAGFFATRRASWLGFNPKFSGFGGETGYIQEKYRKAGRRVLSYPNMQWLHFFCTQQRRVPYPLNVIDKVKNYLIGFTELGLDTEPIKRHFGTLRFEAAKLKCNID
jgi:glycosyltransferase involved in cell wall biosynthesis